MLSCLLGLAHARICFHQALPTHKTKYEGAHALITGICGLEK